MVSRQGFGGDGHGVLKRIIAVFTRREHPSENYQ